MRQLIIKSLMVALCICYALTASTQQVWQRFEANGGIGQSLFEKIYVLRSNEFPEATVENWNKPAWCAGLDYRLSPYFSLGLGGGVQVIGQNTQNLRISINDVEQTFDVLNYRITRTNAGLRALFHYPSPNSLFDFYTGVKFGVSAFTIKVDETGSDVVNEFEERLKFGATTFSSQWVAFGIKYFGLKYIGIYGEVGLGAPSFVQGGICLRLSDVSEWRKAKVGVDEPKTKR